MAANAAKFTILLLAAIAAVQGSSMKDIAVEYSQMLAEQLSTGVDEIDRLKQSSVDQVTRNHQESLMKLVASAQQKVEQTAGTKCQPDAKKVIHKQVTESVTDRFIHCINFTDQITELEKMVYNVSMQVSLVEDGVCLAITNITNCMGENIIQEINCVSAGLLGYINEFTTHSSTIKNIIYAFNKEIRDIGDQFLQCFTNVDNNVVTVVQNLVAQKC